MHRIVWLAPFVALLVACGGARTHAPEGDIGDPIEQFRRDLADPAQHPVRSELAIDAEALREAIRRFGDDHRDLIAARLAASEAGLSPGAVPAEPRFQAIARADDELMVDISPIATLLEVIDPDVRAVVRRTISTTFPVIMTEQLLLPPDVVGLWLGFLGTAEPTWRNCGRTERRLVVCADFGSYDVIVVDLVRADLLWAPAGLTWWQQRPETDALPQ